MYGFYAQSSIAFWKSDLRLLLHKGFTLGVIRLLLCFCTGTDRRGGLWQDAVSVMAQVYLSAQLCGLLVPQTSAVGGTGGILTMPSTVRGS